MAGNQPTVWGGENTSKDYEILMQGATPISKPISLVGHALTSFNTDLTDPTDVPYVRKVGGKIRNFIKRVRAAQQTSLTFTMVFGSLGSIWTPALHRARKGLDCQTTFYAKRVCPENPEYLHAWLYPDAILSPPTHVGDFVTIEDTVMADFQSEVRVEEELLLWAIGGSVAIDEATPFNAVAFLTSDCVDCDEDAGGRLIATGGTGEALAELIVVKTDDRFATIETISTPAPATSVGEDIYTSGNIVLIGFSDGVGVATGTTGGTLISGDGGDTFVLDADITAPIYAVDFYNSQYLAAGGTGAGAALLYVSDDGVTWTAVVSSALPAAAALTSIDVDEEDGVFFVVGEAGTLLRGSYSAGSIVLTDISANLPGSPGELNEVKVFGRRHMAVAGAAGYYAESFDGGATFIEPQVPGSGAITALAGNVNRVMAGSLTAVSERSLLTDFQYTAKPLEQGATLTGNVTDIAMPEDDFNLFVVVTDAGEIAVYKPFYPNA